MTTATIMMICMIFRDDDDSSSSCFVVCSRPGFYFDALPYNLLFNFKSYQNYSSFLVFALPRRIALLRLSLPYIHKFSKLASLDVLTPVFSKSDKVTTFKEIEKEKSIVYTQCQEE